MKIDHAVVLKAASKIKITKHFNSTKFTNMINLLLIYKSKPETFSS